MVHARAKMDRRITMETEDSIPFLIGVIVGAGIFFIVATIITIPGQRMWEDNYVINLRELGQKLCESHNMTLAEYDIKDKLPRFKCHNTEPLDDNIVIFWR